MFTVFTRLYSVRFFCICSFVFVSVSSCYLVAFTSFVSLFLFEHYFLAFLTFGLEQHVALNFCSLPL